MKPLGATTISKLNFYSFYIKKSIWYDMIFYIYIYIYIYIIYLFRWDIIVLSPKMVSIQLDLQQAIKKTETCSLKLKFIC